nr:unnamed protein product [Callosobruchus chinensis]
MNNWPSEEKACVLTSMLRDSAAAILGNLSSSDLRDYSKITSASFKALEIEFATKATRMTSKVRSVVEDDEIEVRATSLTPRRRGGTFHRNPPVRTVPEGTEKLTCWRWGQKGHLSVGGCIQVDKMKMVVGTSDEYANKMKSMQDTITSMKEQFDRDMKNMLKKNEESIDKLRQKHDEAMRKLGEKRGREAAVLKYEIRRLKEELKTVTADRDRLQQLLYNQKRRSMDVNSKFERDMMNHALLPCIFRVDTS